MRLKSTGGRVVHDPLSFSFQMLELGGSPSQKYDVVSASYVPNRELTPYQLRPQLMISDPEHVIAAGDYASYMVNVVWSLTLAKGTTSRKLVLGDDYTVDSLNALSFARNVATDEVVTVQFDADYYDKTRSTSTHFAWQKSLTTQEETSVNIQLDLKAPPKLNFSPFKKLGKFPIEAVLSNGSEAVAADKCVYKWEWFDSATSQFREIVDADELWYVSGKDSGTITVDQDYVQKILLRVTAYTKAFPDLQYSGTVLLRRWYGQWDDVPEFTYAKFIMRDTRKAQVQVTVTNRQGNIANPQQFFDVELFYRSGPKAAWESLGNGTTAFVSRDQMTADHEVGDICRELSAFIPLAMPDGSIITTPDGRPIVGQFPTSDKEGV